MLSPPQSWLGPIPVEEPENAGYWEALRNHALSLQRCNACEKWIHYPLPACPECGGKDLRFVSIAGLGTVYSYTVVHREFGLHFDAPYVSAYVLLNEGVRIATVIIGCEVEDIAIGTAVEVVYHDYPDKELTLAFFTPTRNREAAK
jgi:uncharacterized protein